MPRIRSKWPQHSRKTGVDKDSWHICVHFESKLATGLCMQATDYVKSNPGRTAIVMMDFCCDSSAGGDVLVNTVINQNVRYAQGIK